MKRLTARISIVVAMAFMPILTVGAQGGEGEAAAQATSAPAGMGIFILFLGLAAIIAVGLFYVSQNREVVEAEKKASEQ